jgi:hypothetical protein
MNIGCTKRCLVKEGPNDVIEQIEDKVSYIKYEVPPELLKECQWLDPLESNTKVDRMTTIKINTDRYIECYLLNTSKLKFLQELERENSNDK